MSTATAAMSTADVLNWQASRVNCGDFEEIGHAWVIVLEASKGAAVPQRAVTDAFGVRLEFYGCDVRGRNLMPRIAQTRDRSTLLLLDPIVKQDGGVGLPDIPDPKWQPPIPKMSDVCFDPTKGKKPKEWKPATAPMIRQELAERARGQLAGTNYLVFGPVRQVLVRPKGLAEGWIIECGVSNNTPGVQGTQTDLLIDHTTGQAYFYGGRFQITRPAGQ